ncbi:MAG: ParB N-terminal domain-containing protein [Spirochaetia bacterium]|nr:ParB N-terminal domain-containing protein [Spirochaetia bacterium]MCF7946520.1 ParB N-terminal domain-containing protein [Spirochaetia bacterium]
MQIRVDEIKVKRRIRKDLGDLSQLMDSIKDHGLMNPIVINEKRELIAGERRLESVKALGWKTVDVHIIHTPNGVNKIQMEIDENLYRRPLTTSELAEGFSKIDRLRNPNFLKRFFLFIKRIFRKIFNQSQ